MVSSNHFSSCCSGRFAISRLLCCYFHRNYKYNVRITCSMCPWIKARLCRCTFYFAHCHGSDEKWNAKINTNVCNLLVFIIIFHLYNIAIMFAPIYLLVATNTHTHTHSFVMHARRKGASIRCFYYDTPAHEICDRSQTFTPINFTHVDFNSCVDANCCFGQNRWFGGTQQRWTFARFFLLLVLHGCLKNTVVCVRFFLCVWKRKWKTQLHIILRFSTLMCVRCALHFITSLQSSRNIEYHFSWTM